MKHATNQALDQLEDLLKEIKKLKWLKENKRGIFYFGSIAFLHFHEDPSGLYADLKIDNDFKRFPVNDPIERKKFLLQLKNCQPLDKKKVQR